MYGLTSQLRRAAVSITSNIVEGCYRDGNKEFVRFLHISIASVSELEYQLMLSHDLHYLDDSTYRKISAMVIEEKRMLSTLIYKAKNADTVAHNKP
jgi:four helix bundle protein